MPLCLVENEQVIGLFALEELEKKTVNLRSSWEWGQREKDELCVVRQQWGRQVAQTNKDKGIPLLWIAIISVKTNC